MKTLAIIHYHLNRGGVTRVVRNHLLALQSVDFEVDRVVLLHGGRASDWPDITTEFAGFDVSQRVIARLDYDSLWANESYRPTVATELAGDIAKAVLDPGGLPDDVLLHFHNHALGKNYALPGAVRHLAQQGFRCLLQIHDFAEDLRPDLYQHLRNALCHSEREPLTTQLYPQAAQIHYAVLNGRDLEILTRAGTADDRSHYLPNPVEELQQMPDRRVARQRLDRDLRMDRPVALYPVRGIRRKNVGELLLWAAMFGDNTSFILSLAPINPVEQVSYTRFERLAQELKLPIYFDAGGRGRLSWGENVAASDVMLTTSVAEGFGMVFLESWLTGRRLVGRDLPEITHDFRAAGLRLDGLMPQLRIPIDWCGRDSILESLRLADRRVRAAYGLAEPDPDKLEQELAAVVPETGVDFARLSHRLQARVVRRVSENRSSLLPKLISLNPELAAFGSMERRDELELIRSNATAVQESFGLLPVGRRLANVYDGIMRSDVATELSALPRAEHVLASFVAVRRLYPIRFA